MPEIPDVETFRQYLQSTALHQTIVHVHVESPGLIPDTTPQGLGRALSHHAFESTTRHGKYLLIGMDNDKWLVMHFGMTGYLSYLDQGQTPPDHTRCLIDFESGHRLAYVSQRKLGQIVMLDDPRALTEAQGLGPDALAISAADFIALAGRRRGTLKAWLMDQHQIAGIGNVYSDEILFQARIHPRQDVQRLDRDALRHLHDTMRSVLQAAIDARADPARLPAGFLLPHRHEGGHCPRCNSRLATVRVNGRGAWYCPHCQSSRSSS